MLAKARTNRFEDINDHGFAVGYVSGDGGTRFWSAATGTVSLFDIGKSTAPYGDAIRAKAISENNYVAIERAPDSRVMAGGVAIPVGRTEVNAATAVTTTGFFRKSQSVARMWTLADQMGEVFFRQPGQTAPVIVFESNISTPAVETFIFRVMTRPYTGTLSGRLHLWNWDTQNWDMPEYNGKNRDEGGFTLTAKPSAPFSRYVRAADARVRAGFFLSGGTAQAVEIDLACWLTKVQ